MKFILWNIFVSLLDGGIESSEKVLDLEYSDDIALLSNNAQQLDKLWIAWRLSYPEMVFSLHLQIAIYFLQILKNQCPQSSFVVIG